MSSTAGERACEWRAMPDGAGSWWPVSMELTASQGDPAQAPDGE
jgi:hypothetical protein